MDGLAPMDGRAWVRAFYEHSGFDRLHIYRAAVRWGEEDDADGACMMNGVRWMLFEMGEWRKWFTIDLIDIVSVQLVRFCNSRIQWSRFGFWERIRI